MVCSSPLSVHIFQCFHQTPGIKGIGTIWMLKWIFASPGSAFLLLPSAVIFSVTEGFGVFFYGEVQFFSIY